MEPIKTYIHVTDTIRVEVEDDTKLAVIHYRLQSKVFSQWYYKNDIMEFYNVPQA